ncbi:MAG: hypothetical protein IIB69_08320 [Proteobacteria bacterium]|nr:hypothetical protein [Pseudomonadota bacterium]
MSKFESNNIITALIESNIVRTLLISLLLSFLLITSLGACGNKGPLTLLDEDEKTKKQD